MIFLITFTLTLAYLILGVYTTILLVKVDGVPDDGFISYLISIIFWPFVVFYMLTECEDLFKHIWICRVIEDFFDSFDSRNDKV